MLETMKYINSRGETVVFGREIYVNYNDVRDYEWGYLTKSNRITGFQKTIAKKTLPLVIVGESRKDMLRIRNNLYHIIERDVADNEPGRLYVGEYYLECYLVGGTNEGYLSERDMTTRVTLVTDQHTWVKEANYLFAPKGDQDSEGIAEDYMDYPYDHMYDYSATVLARTVGNSSVGGADFEMAVYGPCNNPAISVGGHDYKVNSDIDDGEYLVINSKTKKIYKVLVNGECVNQFHLRDRTSSVFAQIPEGESQVTWDGSFSFAITVMEGRSEPKWT